MRLCIETFIGITFTESNKSSFNVLLWHTATQPLTIFIWFGFFLSSSHSRVRRLNGSVGKRKFNKQTQMLDDSNLISCSSAFHSLPRRRHSQFIFHFNSMNEKIPISFRILCLQAKSFILVNVFFFLPFST